MKNFEFNDPAPEGDWGDSCFPGHLQAEVNPNESTVLLSIYGDCSYSEHHTVDQLRKLGEWLIEMSNLRHCPECQKIFLRHHRQLFCSRTCTTKANFRDWRNKPKNLERRRAQARIHYEKKTKGLDVAIPKEEYDRLVAIERQVKGLEK